MPHLYFRDIFGSCTEGIHRPLCRLAIAGAIGDDWGAGAVEACLSMSAPREIELKFEIAEQSLSRLRRSQLLKGATTASPKPVRLVSVYFDTDKLKLRNKGFSLRVR